ncbi:MAG: hypothetical protein HOV83_06835 [Catenulispora sp.]|nr:hypothetical protein [Catenulispora sp.]
MNDFYPDEIFDITIKGARVISVAHNGWVRFDVPGGPRHEIAPYSDAFTVERVAPAEWPPQPGDLWRDRNGSTWFAFYGLEAREVFMIPRDPVRGPLVTPTPDDVMTNVGPLSLVHREEES